MLYNFISYGIYNIFDLSKKKLICSMTNKCIYLRYVLM